MLMGAGFIRQKLVCVCVGIWESLLEKMHCEKRNNFSKVCGCSAAYKNAKGYMCGFSFLH